MKFLSIAAIAALTFGVANPANATHLGINFDVIFGGSTLCGGSCAVITHGGQANAVSRTISNMVFETALVDGNLFLKITNNRTGAFDFGSVDVVWTDRGGSIAALIAASAGIISPIQSPLTAIVVNTETLKVELAGNLGGRGAMALVKVDPTLASSPVPEPSAALLFALGGLAIAPAIRRRMQRD